MAPKKGSGGKSNRKASSSNYYSQAGKGRFEYREEPKWQTNVVFKPPKKLSDEVLAAAKKMFFTLDRDNSGSIDADEYACSCMRTA